MRPITLHVELPDMPHPCWRRVVVEDGLTLAEASQGLISLFGWLGYHTDMWQTGNDWTFMSDALLDEDPADNAHVRADGPGGRRWRETARMLSADDLAGRGDIDEPDFWRPARQDEVRLVDLLPGVGDRCWWTYDLGDQWTLTVTRERTPAGAATRHAAHSPQRVTTSWTRHPKRWLLLDGAGGTPPEDAGGTSGYGHNLAVLADPAHPRYAETLTWMWHHPVLAWGPDGFDAARTQRLLDVHDLLWGRAYYQHEGGLDAELAADFAADLGWLDTPPAVPGYPPAA